MCDHDHDGTFCYECGEWRIPDPMPGWFWLFVALWVVSSILIGIFIYN